MKKVLLVVVLAFVYALGLTMPVLSLNGAVIPVYFEPSADTVTLAQQFTVNVVVGNGTNPAYSVMSDEIGFEYNPAVVHVISVTNGPYLASSGYMTFPMTPTIDNVNGNVKSATETITQMQVAPNGTGVIWTVTFNATGVGTSYLNFTRVWLTEPPGMPDDLLPVVLTNGVFEVTQPRCPVANFTVTGVCYCTITEFSDTTVVGDAALENWTWDFGDGNMSYEQNATHHYGAPGPYEVSLTVRDGNGCSDTVTSAVEVFLGPVANFTVTGVCYCTITEFSDTTVAGDAALENWTWDFGDGNMSYEQNATHHYGASGPYEVSLTVRDGNGCSDTIMTSVQVVDCGELAGTVTEGNGTTPIAGAVVNLTQDSVLIASTSSNETGAYLLTSHPAGTYNLTVTKTYPERESKNCAPNTTAVVVVGGTQTIQDVRLRHIADMYWDGKVNMFDQNILVAAWMTCEGAPGYNPVADLVPDGCINMFDLNIFGAEWNEVYY